MILLDITLTTGWLIAIGIVALILIYNLFDTSKEKEKANQKLREMELQMKTNNDKANQKLREIEFQMKANDAELKVTYQKWAIGELEKFKQTEITKVQKTAEEQYREAAMVLLQRWKIEEEAKIRQDAINRSYSVNLGKITEHLIPFHQSFLSQFNPKDARFIGSPIDLIVFDGYADKRDEIQIYIVEIKTGNSKLTEIQKKIKASVLNGNIRWAEINPADNSQTLVIPSNLQTKIDNQLLLNFNDENDLQKLLQLVERKNGESIDSHIGRIADAIQAIGALVDDEGYTLENAIEKTIADRELTFKTNPDKLIFINSISKVFS